MNRSRTAGTAPAAATGAGVRAFVPSPAWAASTPRLARNVTYDAQRTALLVVDNGSAAVHELSRSGSLLNKISIAAGRPGHAAGIALAPASYGSGRTDMYIVDRGVDNKTNPKENDGRLYELSAAL